MIFTCFSLFLFDFQALRAHRLLPGLLWPRALAWKRSNAAPARLPEVHCTILGEVITYGVVCINTSHYIHYMPLYYCDRHIMTMSDYVYSYCILYYTILCYFILLYYIILYCIILYLLYYIILFYFILSYLILYNVILCIIS